MENIVYRYSITLSYSSRKQGLTEVRIWFYSTNPRLFSERNLNNFTNDLMGYLGLNYGLQQNLTQFSPEIGVPLTKSEMEISGHRLNKFYGFTEFQRGKTTTKYYDTSSNGHYWSRSAPFSTLLPKRLTKKELEKRVLRRFKKPKVVKIKRKLWESVLKEAKRTGDKKLMAKARGKLAWAGKSQEQIDRKMVKIRATGIRKRVVIGKIKTYRAKKDWHNWAIQMNKIKWRKY